MKEYRLKHQWEDSEQVTYTIGHPCKDEERGYCELQRSCTGRDGRPRFRVVVVQRNAAGWTQRYIIADGLSARNISDVLRKHHDVVLWLPDARYVAYSAPAGRCVIRNR